MAGQPLLSLISRVIGAYSRFAHVSTASPYFATLMTLREMGHQMALHKDTAWTFKTQYQALAPQHQSIRQVDMFLFGCDSKSIDCASILSWRHPHGVIHGWYLCMTVVPTLRCIEQNLLSLVCLFLIHFHNIAAAQHCATCEYRLGNSQWWIRDVLSLFFLQMHNWALVTNFTTAVRMAIAQHYRF